MACFYLSYIYIEKVKSTEQQLDFYLAWFEHSDKMLLDEMQTDIHNNISAIDSDRLQHLMDYRQDKLYNEVKKLRISGYAGIASWYGFMAYLVMMMLFMYRYKNANWHELL